MRALPQYPTLAEATTQDWIELASDMESDDRARLIGYLGRLDADDMGALIAANRKRWHPHTTPSNVVRTKLLLERPHAEPAYKARRRQMTPIARDMLHRQVSRQGSCMRPDLVAQVASRQDKQHPWLHREVSEIIEENGRLVLVEYRTPAEPMSLATRGASFHHEVSLHYALLAARLAGVNIEGLRICALDAKSWGVDTLDIAVDNALVNDIVREGDRVWADHVLKGIEIPDQSPQGIMTLADLRKPGVCAEGAADELAAIASRFLTWGVAEGECENEREDLQKEAADLLPFSALPLEIDRVDAEGVRFRIDRDLDIEGLTEVAIDLLRKNHPYTREEAEEVLGHPNYWTRPDYSATGLIHAIEAHFNVIPTEDPRFSTAIAKPAQRRPDTLLDLIRSLDGGEQVRLQDFVRSGKLRMEMLPQRARVDRDARQMAAQALRKELKQVLDPVVIVQPKPVASTRKGARRP